MMTRTASSLKKSSFPLVHEAAVQVPMGRPRVKDLAAVPVKAAPMALPVMGRLPEVADPKSLLAAGRARLRVMDHVADQMVPRPVGPETGRTVDDQARPELWATSLVLVGWSFDDERNLAWLILAKPAGRVAARRSEENASANCRGVTPCLERSLCASPVCSV
ncbi:MAG: hypothetical protein JWN86_70 [Planctomycetota bacterium]|nr:hypothetical protein [Planctomycetota bacterium]